MATQAIAVAAGLSTPSIAWAGGEGHLDIYGDFDGGVVRVEYSRDGGTSWAKFDDPRSEFGYWKTETPSGIGFKLPACDIRASVIRANPTALTLAVDSF